MALSIITVYPRSRNLIILILLPFILIAILVFHRQDTQNFTYTPILHGTSEPNNSRKDLYLPRIHQPLSMSILRGILVFYPSDQEAHFLPELLWLYRSWFEMMKDEPLSWRTDLVIYTGNYTLNLQRLGCFYNRIRVDKDELPQCRVFPYQRVLFRHIQGINNDATDHLHQHFDRNRSILLATHLRTYDYLDSINIIAECYPSFAMYDYILRTDMDVFLTKNFGHFVPVNDTLLVGQGGYTSPFSSNRLRRIARDMNWLYANITNIGSTWYGRPRIAQRIANFSLEAMLHLSINEFTKPERQGRLGILLWPEWHHGVLLLYSCDIAINHLVLSENIKIGLAHSLLDQFTTNTDPYDIEIKNRLHLHCWHTEDIFSKFLFKAGKYNHIRPRTLLNDTSASGYALRMALESRIMSFVGLKQGLVYAKKLSNH